MPAHKKKSVADKIIAGLTEFTEALESSSHTFREFTVRTVRLNLHPTKYSPEDVLVARQLPGASQAVFAQFLGVSIKTVQAWEQAQNTPSGAAARLMDEIRRDPELWRARLRELAETVTS